MAALLSGCSSDKPAAKNDSILVEVNDEQRAAAEVAQKFLKAVLTYSNRTSDEDVKGLEYVDQAIHAGLKKQFANYTQAVQEVGGKEKLPEVQDVKVVDVIPMPDKKAYIVNTIVTYNPNRLVMDEFTKVGTVVTFENNKWLITTVNFRNQLAPAKK
ncbi:hypothetical protein [Effusibacillus lacus]|uniref:hypothetical protein n=1 Tax=Effusibacillus lacus TaxID=1348429 RepID=UPI001404B57A|nr:hypothetical protein [Effusibacillus lacus]